MSQRDIERRAKHKPEVLHHVKEISGNVAATCCYYGVSRQAQGLMQATRALGFALQFKTRGDVTMTRVSKSNELGACGGRLRGCAMMMAGS